MMRIPVQQADTPDIDDRKIKRIGIVIVLFCFVLFGGWGALAPLGSAALAPGVVAVDGNRKLVQHLEGGIVQAIYVEDGDHVQAGDQLVRLDDTQLLAELKILKGQLNAGMATESRLIAERDGQSEIQFGTTIQHSPRIVQILEAEEHEFTARKTAREGEINVLEQQIDQLLLQIGGLEALIRSKSSLIASYDEEIQERKALLKNGYVDKARLREIQREKEELNGEVAEHKASIAATQVKAGETKLEILQLNKKFRAEVVNQLTEIQATIYDLKERIVAIEDRVRRSMILAPASGLVMGLATHTVGGVIEAGAPLMEIVPEGVSLIVEAEVSTTDIDRVAVGMEADIRFSAFNSSTTPVIGGKLKTISADRLVNEQTGMPYYLARLEVTEEGWVLLGELTLQPGMPAEVLIKTGSRTLFEYLAKPAADALSRSLIEE